MAHHHRPSKRPLKPNSTVKHAVSLHMAAPLHLQHRVMVTSSALAAAAADAAV